MNKAQNAPDQYWQKFVTDGLVEKGLKPEDITISDVTDLDYSKENPKQALKSLKEVLTPDAHRRLSGRWRKYKYDARHNNTTLTIRRETLRKLQAIASKSGLRDDNYDLLLEYLLDPNEDMEPGKVEVEKLRLESGLDFEARTELLRVKLRFRRSSWRHVLDIVEYAFKSGWVACKALHAKQRTDKARDEAISNFVDKLQSFGK